MKIYKNQTLQSSRTLGLGANFEFASDSVMSPNGRDVTVVLNKDGSVIYYEVTDFNENTATIRQMNRKEYDNFLKYMK